MDETRTVQGRRLKQEKLDALHKRRTDARQQTLLHTEYGDVVAIEYHQHGKRWLPHSIVTSAETYDADWSRRHGALLVHYSGSGHWIGDDRPYMVSGYCDPSKVCCRIWAAPFVTFARYKKGPGLKHVPVGDKALRKLGYERIAEPLGDPFKDCWKAEGHIVHCSICDDYMDEDSSCHHVFTAECGETDGPGSYSDDHGAKESFLRLCAVTGITRGLRRGLVPFRLSDSQRHAVGGLGPSFVDIYSAGKHLGDIARRCEGRQHIDTDELRDGISWLFSLDKKTTKANALTKQWLDEEIAKQNARRTSGDAVYAVRSDYWYGEYVTDEAHADFNADGVPEDHSRHPYEARQKHGQWWTHHAGRDFARRMSWEEARKVRDQIRKASPYDGRDVAIVYCPAPAVEFKKAA